MQNAQFRFTRIQQNVMARHEREILTWICARLPAWVMPDHLTILGIVGAVVIFLSYVASRADAGFLWLASFGFLIHWLGDSLDGSLARHRHIERPIYGYFLDHTVDAIGNLIIMIGLGLTPYVRMDAALYVLVGYYLMCMYVFIHNHLSGILQLSFLGVGPTELRLGLVFLNTLMFFAGDVMMPYGQGKFTLYDMMLYGTGALFTLLFVTRMFAGLRELRDPARGIVERHEDQSVPINLSSASK